jgi:hypothetical protein
MESQTRDATNDGRGEVGEKKVSPVTRDDQGSFNAWYDRNRVARSEALIDKQLEGKVWQPGQRGLSSKGRKLSALQQRLTKHTTRYEAVSGRASTLPR